MADITKYSDLGTPLAFVLPESHALRQIYNNICSSVKNELLTPRSQSNSFYSK